MEILKEILHFFTHLDENLTIWIANYGPWIYAILFLIVFTETGLVIMPLLPGDSLLFAAGALAASGTGLNVWIVIPLLICAALLGDNVNYFIGKFFGTRIKQREKILFLKRSHIEKTEKFYARYGGRTVIMARFVPIVRTVAPFVAGAGSMNYRDYIVNCILGAILWVVGITMLGYLLSGWFKSMGINFEVIVFSIIGISLLPIVIGVIRAKLKKEPAA